MSHCICVVEQNEKIKCDPCGRVLKIGESYVWLDQYDKKTRKHGVNVCDACSPDNMLKDIPDSEPFKIQSPPPSVEVILPPNERDTLESIKANRSCIGCGHAGAEIAMTWKGVRGDLKHGWWCINCDPAIKQPVFSKPKLNFTERMALLLILRGVALILRLMLKNHQAHPAWVQWRQDVSSLGIDA